MKPIGFLLVAVAAIMVAGPAFAADPADPTSGTMDGGPHDMNLRITIPGNQVCVVCHAPHNAIEPLAGPIWNHALPAGPFLRNGVDVTSTLGNSSKKCLGCHDGVTSIGAYGSNAGDPADVVTGGAAIGTNLTDDHPVGIVYADATAHGMEDVADPLVAGRLKDGKVECGSCHRAHSAGLVKTMDGSQLCRLCHKN